MIYQTTTAFEKIVKLTAPIRIIQGGKGSSKTISILQLFILLAISKRENLILSIVAESLPNLKTGALRDFEKLLKSMGLYDKFKVNKSIHTYEYGSNIIEFFSVDGESSRLGSRRTHLYINELDSIKLDTFIELQGRTKEFTICDYNPRKKFYIHEDFIGQPNVDFIVLNYQDNEYIPKEELDSLMFYKRKAEETGNPYWLNKWKVLGLGELGIAEGVIFQEGIAWNLIDDVPESARYIGAGLDFGFSHVTAIPKLYEYYDHHGEYYIILKESLFKEGLTAPRIAQHIMNDTELMSSVIPADSSRPEMISEISSKPYNCPVTSHKKRDVMAGIDLMQTFKILITKDSLGIIEEFRNYSYAMDRQGKSLGVPNKSADMDNSIDATRYAFEYFLSTFRKSRYNTLRWVS